jgi:hypothetical protein
MWRRHVRRCRWPLTSCRTSSGRVERHQGGMPYRRRGVRGSLRRLPSCQHLRDAAAAATLIIHRTPGTCNAERPKYEAVGKPANERSTSCRDPLRPHRPCRRDYRGSVLSIGQHEHDSAPGPLGHYICRLTDSRTNQRGVLDNEGTVGGYQRRQIYGRTPTSAPFVCTDEVSRTGSRWDWVGGRGSRVMAPDHACDDRRPWRVHKSRRQR